MVHDYRDPALETNITTTVTGAATWDPLFEPDPKMSDLHHSFDQSVQAFAKCFTQWWQFRGEVDLIFCSVRNLCVIVKLRVEHGPDSKNNLKCITCSFDCMLRGTNIDDHI